MIKMVFCAVFFWGQEFNPILQGCTVDYSVSKSVKAPGLVDLKIADDYFSLHPGKHGHESQIQTGDFSKR